MWQPVTGPRGTQSLVQTMPCVRIPFAHSYQPNTAMSSHAMSVYGRTALPRQPARTVRTV
jgi:hypothetical protein